MRLLVLIPSVLLAACADGLNPYYGDDAAAPSITGLDVNSELGSIGGHTVVISGSNFGGDASAITVQFDSRNAHVISADNTSITVETPPGPMQGGAVDVAVGTVGGQARLADSYTYELPTRADNQIAYVTLSNDTLSCYGGIYTEDISGCETFAYSGQTGISGRSEAFDFIFPKAHMPFSLGKGGFAPATDISWEEWAIEVPPQSINTLDLEGDTRALRLDIGEVTISNPALEGETFCADLTSAGTFVYNGDDPYVPSEDASDEDVSALEGYIYPNATIYPDGDLIDEGSCSDANAREYDLGNLQFCEVQEYETSRTYVYEADWMAGENFFRADPSGNGRLDSEAAIPVTLSIPNAGISEDIVLTEYARFANVAEADDDVFWFNRGDVANDACSDTTLGDDGDRITSGGDAAFEWVWEPSAVEHELSDGGLKSVDTYVKVTISYFALSWLGGDGLPIAATITVPDDFNYDEETGLSSLSLPSWVLYSMPSADTSYGYVSSGQFGGTEWTGWAQNSNQYYGLVVITMDRITEYTFDTTVDGRSGELVFAYNTGDMGLFLWDNPLDSLDVDSCADCVDNDGDGWVDDLDPDCIDGDAEVNASTDSTCNDGIDNDGDALIDWEDDDCIDGTTGESAECSDNIDNDADGWIDQDDPDCITDVFENNDTFGDYTCNDGVDNDNDGWIDGDDLACEAGNESEDDGFQADYQCNNGADDDAHGDPDALDLHCVIYGPDTALEEDLSGTCADGIDNDKDGYTDGFDPDCDLGSTEVYSSYEDWPAWGGQLELQCYNAVDDDGDGAIDVEDPGCFDDLDNPSGHEADEAKADPASSTCNDGIDNDKDGWTDSDDPDCALSTDEDDSAYGFYACNDGIDNDKDGLTDAFDVLGCASGLDDDESDPK